MHSIRPRFPVLLTVLVPLLCALPSAAQGSAVEAHRARAAKLAAAGKWDAAIEEMADAKDAAKNAFRRELKGTGAPAFDLQYRTEVKALQQRYARKPAA